jgi:hypothetical protein
MNRVASRRRVWWILGGIVTVLLVLIGLSYLIGNEPLRRYVEHQINSHLKGYTVHLGRAYFHPLAFALDLHQLTLEQDANPNPPVADIKRFYASLHWRALLSTRLVGDLLLDRPKVQVNLMSIRKEEENKVPLDQKGWQQALESIYPLKINEFRIRDGDVTYVDEGPYKPLSMSRVNIYATNIRNIRSPRNVYPSAFHMDATVFDRGRLVLDGNANFMLEPHLGIRAAIDLSDMELGYFAPITNRGNIIVRKGTLSTKGDMEYSPHGLDVTMKSLDLKGVDVDYVHLPETVTAEQRRVEQAAHAAAQLRNKPAAKIRAEVLAIKESRFGYVNKTSTPNYHLFIDRLDASLKHFSNQFVEGPATLELRGRFMGTGDTRVTGTFRPETKSSDFTVNVAIENTDMPAMSDLFRTFGNFDIKAGLFSFYSELTVKDNIVNGYLKPIFKDMQVYDRRPPQEKSFFHKLYVGMVSGLSKLLENRSRREVATKAAVSGPLESPTTNTWQIIANLIRNAFISSILPGFEKEVSESEHGPRKREEEKPPG